MPKRTSNTKFQTPSTGYLDKHGNKLASKLPIAPPNHADADDDESGGGNGKGKLGSYKLENLLKELDKGTFKAAKDFGNYLNKHGLDGSEIKKSELSKEVEQQTEKTAAADKKAEIANNSQNARASTTQGTTQGTAQGEAKNSATSANAKEMQVVRNGFFGENDHQGKVIQTSMGFSAEMLVLEGQRGSAPTGSIANIAASYLAKQGGAQGRYMLHNNSDKSAPSSVPAAAEVQSKGIGRQRN